jgi:hypothetical protein
MFPDKINFNAVEEWTIMQEEEKIDTCRLRPRRELISSQSAWTAYIRCLFYVKIGANLWGEYMGKMGRKYNCPISSKSKIQLATRE